MINPRSFDVSGYDKSISDLLVRTPEKRGHVYRVLSSGVVMDDTYMMYPHRQPSSDHKGLGSYAKWVDHVKGNYPGCAMIMTTFRGSYLIQSGIVSPSLIEVATAKILTFQLPRP